MIFNAMVGVFVGVRVRMRVSNCGIRRDALLTLTVVN